MSDATRTADPKSQRRGLESDGANPSEPADVLDAIDMVLEAWIDPPGMCAAHTAEVEGEAA